MSADPEFPRTRSAGAPMLRTEQDGCIGSVRRQGSGSDTAGTWTGSGERVPDSAEELSRVVEFRHGPSLPWQSSAGAPRRGTGQRLWDTRRARRRPLAALPTDLRSVRALRAGRGRRTLPRPEQVSEDDGDRVGKESKVSIRRIWTSDVSPPVETPTGTRTMAVASMVCSPYDRSVNPGVAAYQDGADEPGSIPPTPVRGSFREATRGAGASS